MLMKIARFGGNAPGLPELPGPAPLPSLSSAFSRRAALFGAVAATGFLGAAAGPVIAGNAGIEMGSADTRLGAIYVELVALQARAELEAPHAMCGRDDPYDATVARMDTLSAEMDRTGADTFTGVLHKLRAAELPIVGDAGAAHDFMCSICSDITRLHAAGRIV